MQGRGGAGHERGDGVGLGLLATLWLAASWPGGVHAQTATSGPQRFVDIIELTDHDDQADIVVQFTCSLRYVTHLPATEGNELRIELQPLPDCGVNPGSSILGELPPLSGGGNIISAARVESDVPGQVTLVLSWRKLERFILAQGVDTRGMRVRLIDRARGRGKILLNESSDSVNNFAVNLESQPKPFDPAALALAHERLKAPVFVSEVLVEDQKWYRLRVGPIERRLEAERLLNLALPDYPRAWLAIGDDTVTSDPNAAPGDSALPAVERLGADPPLATPALAVLFSEARSAISARDYPRAITILTKLQRQPEFPDRSHAQELLGLARERSGQLAHAKAEYEEYLRRYPHGDAAERVAHRLRILRAASAKVRSGSGEGGSRDLGWQVTGGVAQLFRYDGTRVDNGTPPGTAPPGSVILPSSTQTTTQNALYNDFDLLARHRGENLDVLARVSAGYAKNFASTSQGDLKRVSLATIEIVDRALGVVARLGRQSRNDNGVLGTFDGLFTSYQFRPAWALNLTAGLPVEQTDLGPKTGRRFENLALAYTPPGAHWDASVFAATQQFDGVRDRQAVGFEARYLVSKRSLIALLDYDTSFRSVNAAALLGTLQLPAHWSMSVDLERRNAPVLTTRNALIGQPDATLAQLQQVFTIAEIFQLARDRTAATTNYSLTASRPIGERFQFSTTVAADRTGATVASGGVDAQPASGLELAYQTQIYGTNLWQRGDFHVLSLAYAKTEVGKIDSLGITSRFRLSGSWRIGPRLTVDRRVLASDGSSETSYIPSLLLDFQHERKLLQLEVGGQLGKRSALLQTQNTKRYYVSLAYRIGF